jgi:hypothetical protein
MIDLPTCDWLKQLQMQFPELDLLPPAPPEVLAEAESVVGELPKDLAELLACSNGLVVRSFRVFSALDRRYIKKTWESLQRANERTPRTILKDSNLSDRFLVFADIGNGAALFDKNDGTIWYTETDDAQIWRTNLSFREFIETMIENAE